MSLATSALAAALAAATAAVLAELFRRWALHASLLDVPNDRSSHRVPIPRGGGVGIVAGFLLGLSAWVALGGAFSPRAVGWLLGALFVATVSFADDVRSLSIPVRIGTHVTGAFLLSLAGVQESSPVALAGALLAAFAWVTVVTNVYNFMDGIDGLASAQAIVAGLAYALAGILVGNPLLHVAGLLLAGACAGFLVHNLPPARLFMGDVASTFLGFSFAGLALLGNLGVGGGRLPIEFGVAVLAPFLFDGLVTLARRVLRGERWFEAHRSHYYQRLVRLNLSHGQVSGLYTILAMLAAGAALLTLLLDSPLRPLMAALAFVPMLGVVGLVWRLEHRAAQLVPLAPRGAGRRNGR